MVKRVAKALYDLNPHMWAVDVPGRAGPLMQEMTWEEAEERGTTHPLYLEARAALLALRNPTEEMVEAGERKLTDLGEDAYCDKTVAAPTFQAMIDNAIAEASEE